MTQLPTRGSNHPNLPAGSGQFAKARHEWSKYARFIARPQLPDGSEPIGKTYPNVIRILVLDLLFMGGLLLVFTGIEAAGLEIPETALSGFEMTPSLLFFVVLGAPLLEEFAFRFWLNGRPAYVFSALIAVGGVVAVSLFASGSEPSALAAGASLLFGVGGILAFVLLRGREQMGWFKTAFPVLFWLSSFGFAAIHLGNFEGENWLMLVPLVVPQLIAGTIMGYTRVHYGFAAGVVLHALHNAILISFALGLGG